MMETRRQRVVLRGWDAELCPEVVLRVYPAASKVEALCRREDGRASTVVVGFKDEGDARLVRGRQEVWGRGVWADSEEAYSARCRSDSCR